MLGSGVCEPLLSMYSCGPFVRGHRSSRRIPGLHAKDAQVACIRRLIYNGTDVILIAPMGFGKSLIMQAISILRKDTTSIISLPLNEIAKEQSQKVNQIGGRALLFNADIKDMDKEIKLAKDGHYTHIFISPQLASTSTFRDVLKRS
jgi:superfamily II DNA helicase RecQ